jgi:hypothetical protein
MEFFRAVPDNTDISKPSTRLPTRRLPSNIPYFVDNIWEFLRPANKPSRRHAIYASPTVELAAENASASTNGGYIVYKLVFDRAPVFMQLSVTDARYHPDVKALQRIVHSVLGADFGSLALPAKLAVAPLFLPGVSAAELEQAAQASPRLRDILDQAASVSTIWTGGDVLDPTSKGELFFELEGDNSYTLQPL